MSNDKKIGVVTLHGYSNYGNRLQNYALIHTIRKMNFNAYSCVITMPTSKYLKNNYRKARVKKVLENPTMDFFKKINDKLYSKMRSINTSYPFEEQNRQKKFKEFSKKHLFEEFYSIENKNDKKMLEEYSFFITGSDQVWNPNAYQKLPVYFLTFALKEKRIAYAPSIGRDEIPQEFNNDYKLWLEDMSAISVREEAGATIIKELTDIDAPVLVDPTMLLTKEEWMAISTRATNRPDAPYLLTYFLGGPTDKTREKLEKLANEKNMTIINLGDITDKDTYETGPNEFLDYINNASAFFTDSFHGVVFSIIFQTPFIAYERITSGPSMYSRIETILDNFDMRDREANGFNKDIFSMDFSGTHEVLEREYNKSIDYLKEALRIEG